MVKAKVNFPKQFMGGVSDGKLPLCNQECKENEICRD